MAPSTMPEMREGDWNCTACGNHNYASRQACNKCGQPKPGATGGFGAAKAGGKGRDMPYAYGSMPYGYGTPAYGAAAYGAAGYGAVGYGAAGYGAAGYGAAGKGMTAPALPATARPGDWMCPSCGNHNYANKSNCNRCHAPKPQNGMGGAFAAMLQMGATPSYGVTAFNTGAPKHPSNMREGDWLCKACGNHNYANRSECNKCGVGKDVFISKSGMRPGDWVCSSCGNHNYADKAKCNKCGAAKETAQASLKQEATKVAQEKKQKSAEAGKQLREGDWICTGCGNHNYASRQVCNKCNAPKPAV